MDANISFSPISQNSNFLSMQEIETKLYPSFMNSENPSLVLQKLPEVSLSHSTPLLTTTTTPLVSGGIVGLPTGGLQLGLPSGSSGSVSSGAGGTGAVSSGAGGVAGLPSVTTVTTAVATPRLRGGLPPRVPLAPTSAHMTETVLSEKPQGLSTQVLTGHVANPPAHSAPPTIINIQSKSFLKDNYVYKMLLFLLALGVCLYLTKNYWWKYIVQKFFPSDVKKSEAQNFLEMGKFLVSESPYVKELKETDAKEVLGPSSYVKIVMIYANWCQHCEIMMPAFEEAAKLMSEFQTKNPTSAKVMFMRAEAMSVPSLANRPSVPGFPTVVGIFQNGKEFPYMGPRTPDSLFKFAELLCSTASGVPEKKSEEGEKPRKVNLQTLLANASQQLPVLPGSPEPVLETPETKIESLEESSDSTSKEDAESSDGVGVHEVGVHEGVESSDVPDDEGKATLTPVVQPLDSLKEKKESSKRIVRKKNLKL